MDLQQNRCTPNILPKYIALDGTLENIDPNGGTGRNIPVDASFDLTNRIKKIDVTVRESENDFNSSHFCWSITYLL